MFFTASLTVLSLFYKKRREQFPLNAIYKRLTVSKSIFHSQKTSYSLKKPNRKFPTMATISRWTMFETNSNSCFPTPTSLQHDKI